MHDLRLLRLPSTRKRSKGKEVMNGEGPHCEWKTWCVVWQQGNIMCCHAVCWMNQSMTERMTSWSDDWALMAWAATLRCCSQQICCNKGNDKQPTCWQLWNVSAALHGKWQPCRANKKTEQMPKTLCKVNNKYVKHIVMDRQPRCNLTLCIIECLTWASMLIQK